MAELGQFGDSIEMLIEEKHVPIDLEYMVVVFQEYAWIDKRSLDHIHNAT
jgi:hypothetical protein